VSDAQIPTGPIEAIPFEAIPRPSLAAPRGASAERFRAELLEALDGIELGAYDRRIVDWLASWDAPTVATVCSWLLRKGAHTRSTDQHHPAGEEATP
jgi:hypothetical protein